MNDKKENRKSVSSLKGREYVTLRLKEINKSWPNEINKYELKDLIRFGDYNSEVYEAKCLEDDFQNLKICIKVIDLEQVSDIDTLRVFFFFYF
jgi:hypothetical protein